MKKICLTTVMIFNFMVMFSQSEYCNPEILEKAKEQLDSNSYYLKDFQTHLKDNKVMNGDQSVAKYSMVLSKNTTYQFSIASDNALPGKAVFELYTADELIGTTDRGWFRKNDKTFIFKCQKTGVYHMFLRTSNGKECCVVGILAYMKE